MDMVLWRFSTWGVGAHTLGYALHRGGVLVAIFVIINWLVCGFLLFNIVMVLYNTKYFYHRYSSYDHIL